MSRYGNDVIFRNRSPHTATEIDLVFNESNYSIFVDVTSAHRMRYRLHESNTET